jgi:hypothetical protein
LERQAQPQHPSGNRVASDHHSSGNRLNVRGKNGEEQRDQTPPRQSPCLWKKNAEATGNFARAANHDELRVPG